MVRNKSLDGIRGLMAINVVICHFICAYYPEMYFIDSTAGNKILKLFAYTPLSALVNGNIAVQYFFVLSGFLTASMVFYSNKKNAKQITEKCISRYFRLLPMILAATFLTFILMKENLMYHLDIVGMLKNGSFYESYCNFKPTLIDCLYNGFIRTFIKSSNYVGPFWTIRYELLGYIVCIICCTLLKGNKARRIIYICIVLVLCIINMEFYYLLPFILGVYIADFIIYRDDETTYFSKYYNKILYSRKFEIICFCIGIYLSTIPMFYVGIHSWLGIFKVLPTSVFRAIGLAIIFYLIQMKKFGKKFFETRCLQWLGKISFPIYSFHWPLMLSFQSYVFSKLILRYSYDIASIIAFLANFCMIMVVSYIMWFLIEKSKISSRFVDLIFKNNNYKKH